MASVGEHEDKEQEEVQRIIMVVGAKALTRQYPHPPTEMPNSGQGKGRWKEVDSRQGGGGPSDSESYLAPTTTPVRHSPCTVGC